MYKGLQRRRSNRLVQETEIDPLLSLKSFGNPNISLLPPHLKRLPLYGILSPPASPPRKIRVCGISTTTTLSQHPIPVFLLAAPTSIPFCTSMAPSLQSSPVKKKEERKIESPRRSNPCGTSAMDALLDVISRVSPASQKSTLNSHIQQTPIQTNSPTPTHSIMSTNLNLIHDETMHEPSGLDSNAETQCVNLSLEGAKSTTVQLSQPTQVRFCELKFTGFPIFEVSDF